MHLNEADSVHESNYDISGRGSLRAVCPLPLAWPPVSIFVTPHLLSRLCRLIHDHLAYLYLHTFGTHLLTQGALAVNVATIHIIPAVLCGPETFQLSHVSVVSICLDT